MREIPFCFGKLISIFALGLALLFPVGAAGRAGTPPVPAGWRSGIGLSWLADPYAAADEAAGEAKAGLGGGEAKFVFAGAANPQVVPELIEGLKKHFPAEIIYGCQVSSPLVAESNFPDEKSIDIQAGVQVWALGGEAVEVGIFTVSTELDVDNPYEEAGIELGREVRPFIEGLKTPGRLIFTFGDQYNGSNKDFVNGLNQGLGKIYPLVGGAAGNQTALEIIRGEIQDSMDVAVVIGGPFRLGQTLSGGTHTPETADMVMAEAVAQGGGAAPFFAMLFNCRRRRQGMIEHRQLAEELDHIRRRLPGIEFFGFYGPGEVGSDRPGEPARGVGFTVTTAVFFPAG
ncbi:MAG: FIST C-terminal domain-containing protein [Planctomycetota bacterium]|jgi:hypothetical protein|nr:FIST C-terminal domain-containing protein [Planctomycetota bacterium]